MTGFLSYYFSQFQNYYLHYLLIHKFFVSCVVIFVINFHTTNIHWWYYWCYHYNSPYLERSMIMCIILTYLLMKD